MGDREPEPEPEPARAPTRKTRRKPKKGVPVGRNGLKKRRVVKSRMATDEKGYFGASAAFIISICELYSKINALSVGFMKLLRITRRTNQWTRRRLLPKNPRKGKERNPLLLSR